MSEDLVPNQQVKKNADLFEAFFKLAQSLNLKIRRGKRNTSHEYDPIKVGKRPLQNALCVKESSTSFFTNDPALRSRLAHADTGFSVEPAPFRESSPHNEYRFTLSNITTASLEMYPGDFRQLVRESVAYVENPIAGNTARKAQDVRYTTI